MRNSSFVNLTIGASESQEWLTVKPTTILLSLFLVGCTTLTITGNLLVIFAVVKERYLRSITNHFIVSLAIADLLMGSIVMPFSVIHLVLDGYWPFGHDWCDLWHAFDVLSSTASILNLCMIAVERYLATKNPITYPTLMTRKRCLMMIAAVWLCSSAISFPAIIWWRAVSKPEERELPLCDFTNNRSYLLISSTISFYVPLVVMIVVYCRIYRTASKLIQSLNAGTKVIYKNSQNGEVIVLRIHRGGGGTGGSTFRPRNFSGSMNTSANSKMCNSTISESEVGEGSSNNKNNHNVNNNIIVGGVMNNNRRTNSDEEMSDSTYKPMINSVNEDTETDEGANMCISKKIRLFAMGKRLTKFAREQKAAKTLGIVMGIFIICWLPFFICNIIIAVDISAMGHNIQQVMTVVTWLGYVNSSINPIIYAHSMRDFRRAFIKLLCSCYLRRQAVSLDDRFFFADNRRSIYNTDHRRSLYSPGSSLKSPQRCNPHRGTSPGNGGVGPNHLDMSSSCETESRQIGSPTSNDTSSILRSH